MPGGEGWDVPKGVTPWSEFHWFRVPVNRVLLLWVLSEQPLWYAGHFVGKRMVPCYGEGCAECAKGTGAQLRYVLACCEQGSGRVGLLEVGRSVAVEIRDRAGSIGKLRGTLWEFGRHSHSKQSRLEASLVDGAATPFVLSREVPDIRRALRATWQKAGLEIPEGFEDRQPVSDRFRRPSRG